MVRRDKPHSHREATPEPPLAPPVSILDADFLFPHEDPLQWAAVRQLWTAEFPSDSPLVQQMVLRAAQADWELRRELSRTHQLERSLLEQHPDPTHWPPEQYQLLTRQRRERRHAEARVHTLRNAIEDRLRARLLLELHAHRSEETHSTGKRSAPTAQAQPPAPPRPPDPLLQIVIIKTVDGQTQTIYNPENAVVQRMIQTVGQDGRQVIRTLKFPPSLPLEYSWAATEQYSNPRLVHWYLSQERFQEEVQREERAATGHLSPNLSHLIKEAVHRG